jgi:DNA-binding CsgD family transcriptional regulator
MGMKRHTAYALIGLALTGPGEADPGWSARLHGAADQALADLGHTLQPLEARLADRDRQRLRAMMGDAAFEAEYAAGRTLDPAQVLVALGRTDAASGQLRAPLSGEAASVLTRRELDVLTLVAQGLSNPDIARRLVLSEHTIHRHLANILRKLNLSSRAAAAAWGVRTGLV